MKSENIYVKDGKLVIEIPLLQDSFDAVGCKIGKIDNVVGMACDDDVGFANIIDQGYKNSFDYSDFFFKTGMSTREFETLCNKLGITFYEYPRCAYCGDSIMGSHTMGKKGNMCYRCEEKKLK